MSAIILLEDEPVLRREIAEFLDEIGHDVDAVSTIAEFDQTFDRNRHTIAIIDLLLPDGDGIDLIKTIRGQGSSCGIVVVTARRSTPQRASGYNAGADHYLTKPFDLVDLASVLMALERRVSFAFVTQKWTLDTLRCQLVPPNKAPIPLSGSNYIILKAIFAGEGKLVSRRTLVEALGEKYVEYDLRRLDSQIHYLRKMVRSASGLDVPIKSARGRGYQTTEQTSLRN